MSIRPAAAHEMFGSFLFVHTLRLVFDTATSPELSPLDYSRAPSESRAEDDQQHEVASLNFPNADGFIKRDGD